MHDMRTVRLLVKILIRQHIHRNILVGLKKHSQLLTCARVRAFEASGEARTAAGELECTVPRAAKLAGLALEVGRVAAVVVGAVAHVGATAVVTEAARAVAVVVLPAAVAAAPRVLPRDGGILKYERTRFRFIRTI